VVERVPQRGDARVRDQPMGRLEPHTARPRRGRPQRSGLVGADGHVDGVGDHRDGGPARGTAGEVAVVDRVGDRTGRRHLAAARDRHLVHVGLGGDRRPRIEQLLDDEGVVTRDVPRHHRRATGHLDARDGDVVLDAHGQPRERAVSGSLDATAGDDGVARVLLGPRPVAGVAPTAGAPARALGPLTGLREFLDPLVDAHSLREQRREVRDLLVGQIEPEVLAVFADLPLRRRAYRRG